MQVYQTEYFLRSFNIKSIKDLKEKIQIINVHALQIYIYILALHKTRHVLYNTYENTKALNKTHVWVRESFFTAKMCLEANEL